MSLLITGMVLPYLFAVIVPVVVVAVLLLLIIFVLCVPRYRVFALLPAGVLITTFALSHRLAQRLPAALEKSRVLLTGTIVSLPDYRHNVVRFDFLPDSGPGDLPSRLRVYWYTMGPRSRTAPIAQRPDTSLPGLHAGERWQLQLELRTTKSRVNFHGMDAERWLFAEGIGALASVQQGPNQRLNGPSAYRLAHWRERLWQSLERAGRGVPGLRLLEALAIGDRRALLRSDRRVLSATGTGHLLAISGLHIGLAASMGFYLGRLGLWLLPIRPRQRFAVGMPWLVAWLTAFAYALVSGFGVSTQRALIMLSVAAVVMVGRRYVHPLLAWMIALALVLLVDPFAPLRAGFWFSFTAVGVLLLLFIPRYGRLPAWRRITFAQLGISLIMAPLGMYWFQQLSLPGLVANLFAIPVVSLIVVPLLLLAMLLLSLPLPLATWCLSIAGFVAHGLMQVLGGLAALQPEILTGTRTPGLMSVLLAMTGAAVLLLPRAVPGRLAGIFLLLPLAFTTAAPVAPGRVQIDLLDVGQGLSVLVSNDDYLLVYDTGPGNGLAGEARWDMVTGSIEPMIRASGQAPDLIVASHADLDHAGGLAHLQQIYPRAQVRASLPYTRQGILPCRTPASWVAGNLRFRILHPSPGLPYLGNDSSCVISVRAFNVLPVDSSRSDPQAGFVPAAGLSLLLSGDISQVVERRLVDNGLRHYGLVTVPHHGSASSSSQRFIDQVSPLLALVSSAPGNRFGFPRADVLARYAARNIRVLNSADCGGIRVVSDNHGDLELTSARRIRSAIWRWPAAGVCP